MLPIEGQPILTAAQMRAAEERAAPTPDTMYALMERAGAGVAEAVRRLAAGAEVLILCGPGNNGGDGYVAARVLREAGYPVRVATLAEPATDLARRARAGWTGPVTRFPQKDPANDAPAPVLVDAVFGVGLSRPIEHDLSQVLDLFTQKAKLSIAIDLPSGVDADTGEILNVGCQAGFDVTLALGAVKPCHVLMPGLTTCGAVRLIDVGLNTNRYSDEDGWLTCDKVIEPPYLRSPGELSHKYTRGLVVVIGGAMPGAAGLAVTAAMRAGAGYGLLFSDGPGGGLPHAVVQRGWSPDALVKAIEGKPNTVVIIGPGLGRDDEARAKLEAAIACDAVLIIDGDALHLVEERHFGTFAARADWRYPVVLTPHAGEFAALFGKPSGSKIEAARAAARRSGAIVAFKGADTVVAHPNGRTATLVGATPWLSTAGTGDVLTGAIAGVWQLGFMGPVEAGVWLHAEAARRCGPAFIADDLAHALTPARAALATADT